MKRLSIAALGITSLCIGALLALGLVVVVLEDALPPVALLILLLPEVLLMADGAMLLALRKFVPKPAGDAATAEPAESAGDADASGEEAAAPVDRDAAERAIGLFARSEDVVATAADLVRTWRQGSERTHEQEHLASMLEAIGIQDWQDAPQVEASLIRRTGLFWFRGLFDELRPGDYDRLVACEAALNIHIDLPRLTARNRDEDEVVEAVDTYLRAVVDQDVEPLVIRQDLAAAYPKAPERGQEGEWIVRERIVHDAEFLRLPFRLAYDLRGNVQSGEALVSVEVPPPASFAIVTADERGQVSRARAYALRLSWLVASRVLASSPRMRRAHVVCHAHGSDLALLETSFDHRFADHMAPIVRDPRIEGELFPHDANIHASFGEDGWFVPFEPRRAMDDEAWCPREHFQTPELDVRDLSSRTAKACGAAKVCDLAINEHGTRQAALLRLTREWEAMESLNNEGVVATLMELRDTSDDMPVVEACDRVVGALLEGSLDPTDLDAIRHLFMWGGALDQAVLRVSELAEAEPETLDPATTVRILGEALEPMMAVGFYADDESAIYRYFASVADRFVFNTRIDDHRREVRLVPDAYFNALAQLCGAQTAMGEYEQAGQTADELMRVAPNCMNATLCKARVLECESRLFEAAELIQEALALVSNPRDAALGHYRLAYMEWRLGRGELAVACYERAMRWPSRTAANAREELDDLLQTSDELRALEPEEAADALGQAGIPLGFDDGLQARLLCAAALLTDDEAFVPAQQLLAVVCSATGDDVLTGMWRSMESEA